MTATLPGAATTLPTVPTSVGLIRTGLRGFSLLRSRGCLLEADAVSHALELGDEAVAAAGVVVGSSDEPVGAEVGVGGVVVQQMPGDHQDGVPDCQGGFFLPMRRARRQNWAAG